jgi:hypothetical protein
MARRSNKLDDPLILEAALEGLELQKKRIETQINEIRNQLGKRPQPAPEETPPSKRRLSTEARKRIAAAQKKRWAEYRKINASPK